jgi:uncharacterized protein (UPF0276 family)
VTAPAIGLPLHPDPEYLERVMPLLEREVDVLELAPETTWALADDGALISNGYHAQFLALGERLGLPFIAHGVGLSPGSAGDDVRRARWLTRIAADHRRFEFRWYTDHLGATVLDGLEMALPLGLPMTAECAAIVRARLHALQQIVPCVGLENSAIYFTCGDPLAEPGFLSAILGDAHHLLLDLYNLHTMAENFGFDPADYLARLDLSRVIEIHLAGGRSSEPDWLRSRRTLLLDSHDDHVPEPVWRLLARVLPDCPGLRAVIVERMEGTVGPGDERALADELRRARRLVELLHRPGVVRSAPAPAGPIALEAQRAHERALAAVLRAEDPAAALAAAPAALRHTLRDVDPDGLRLAALLIARLRFERLQHGDLVAARRFDEDPAGFAEEFRRYHAEVAPTAAFPQDEGALYRRWRA